MHELALDTIWKVSRCLDPGVEQSPFYAIEFHLSLIFIYVKNKYVPRTLQEILICSEKLQATAHVVEGLLQSYEGG